MSRIHRTGSDSLRVSETEAGQEDLDLPRSSLRQSLLQQQESDVEERDAFNRQGTDGEEDDVDEDDALVRTPLTPFSRSPVVFFRERFQAGSIKGSVFTLVVAIVGAGTLSVPYAVEQSGVLLGSLLFAIGAMMAFFSLQLLVISSELTGIKSYPGIARQLYGNWAYRLAQASLLLNLYGTSISYIVASGSMISTVLKVAFDKSDGENVSWALQSKFVMVMTTALIVVPLSLLRTMGALRYSSLIGVACSVYLTIVVVVKYFVFCSENAMVVQRFNESFVDRQEVQCFWSERHAEEEAITLARFGFEDLLSTIPIVVYAYTCHPNVLPIFMELQKPTRRRMYKVVGRAIGLAFVLYALLGVFGYLTFKSQLAYSNGNFLNNDYHKDTEVLLGAIGMSFSVILAIPLFVNAFRANIYRIFAGERANPKDAPLLWHVVMSLGMVGLALLPAILIEDISNVFKLLGSTTNPIICFVLPSMFIIRSAPKSMYRTEKVLSVICAVVISIVSLFSLVKTIQQWGGTQQTHQKQS